MDYGIHSACREPEYFILKSVHQIELGTQPTQWSTLTPQSQEVTGQLSTSLSKGYSEAPDSTFICIFLMTEVLQNVICLFFSRYFIFADDG